MKTRSSNPALRRSDTAGEDKELAAFLTAELDKVLSASHEPRPRCPRCGGSHITSAGFRTRPIGRLPMFACQTCRRYFSRTAAPTRRETSQETRSIRVLAVASDLVR